MSRGAPTLDPELGPLTLDRLTRDVWLWQRQKGHRFSVDDVATAFVAARRMPDARSILDLGCGIGSVLLHLAWSLPDARLVGIEAQAVSFALLERNVAHNYLHERVRVVHGDLRDRARWADLGRGFDLVTGTPPYFPVGHALAADDEQRTLARLEVRGGVEAYIETAGALMSVAGAFVLCGASAANARVLAAARAAGLYLEGRTDIVARAPNPPLFSVWTLVKQLVDSRPPTALVIRDASGARTEDAASLRAFSGID
ncbi:MAG: methyltransferase [Myxococcota bacterium]